MIKVDPPKIVEINTSMSNGIETTYFTIIFIFNRGTGRTQTITVKDKMLSLFMMRLRKLKDMIHNNEPVSYNRALLILNGWEGEYCLNYT